MEVRSLAAAVHGSLLHTMKRSLLSLSPLISSTNLCYRTSLLARLKPRLCLSARPSSFSTLFLARALHDFRTPPSTLREQSILQFLSSRLAQATHRSVIRGGRAGGSYGGGPQGPWQRLRARINAIPSNYIFWGIIGLNGLVFASWNLAWIKYVSPQVRWVVSVISLVGRALAAKHGRPIFVSVDEEPFHCYRG